MKTYSMNPNAARTERVQAPAPRLLPPPPTGSERSKIRPRRERCRGGAFGREAAAALTLLTTAAQAHPGHGIGAISGGLASGLAHPFLGLDHLLAMVAVGLWSAVALPAGKRWTGPACFLVMLLGGALLAAAGLPLPSIEIDMALSVILLGGMLLAHRHVPASIGLAMIAAAAVLHGHAHGSEWVRGSSFAGYAVGFMLASAALHGAGLLAGDRLQRLAPWVWKAGAALIGASGILMLAARL